MQDYKMVRYYEECKKKENIKYDYNLEKKLYRPLYEMITNLKELVNRKIGRRRRTCFKGQDFVKREICRNYEIITL